GLGGNWAGILDYLDDPSKCFRALLEIIPIKNDLLSVSGLAQGVYKVLMDGPIALIFESDQTVICILLHLNPESPSFKQS
ncbi:MAG TPA: hypothetical protein DCS60_03955, partial [Opitutae bacterium]|nr:hypothetical protein [Opitutae bacterium]